MSKLNPEQFVRIKDLANYPERKERVHRYKNGKTKRIGARPASRGMIGVSDKTIWLWVKHGDFPAPLKLSENVTVWRLSDVKEWMASKGLEV